MASETGYAPDILERKRKTGEGILATPPASHRIKNTSYKFRSIKTPQTKPRFKNLIVPPQFIGELPYPGSVSNKFNIMDTSKSVKHTFLSYIKSSKHSSSGTIIMRKLKTAVLFSCYNKLLSGLIGYITHMLQISSIKKFIPLIVGGMALRFYNQSYITSDLDVKIYPLDIDETFTLSLIHI